MLHSCPSIKAPRSKASCPPPRTRIGRPSYHVTPGKPHLIHFFPTCGRIISSHCLPIVFYTLYPAGSAPEISACDRITGVSHGRSEHLSPTTAIGLEMPDANPIRALQLSIIYRGTANCPGILEASIARRRQTAAA